MEISLIAAVGKNGVIGKNNSLPWNLPADMKHFRELTLGKVVIMGRKTFESIGNPLPKRINIVLTKKKDYNAEGCNVFNSVNEALAEAKSHGEIMIIGGAEIYTLFLPLVNKMYLTLIDAEIDGDSYFPKYNKNEWKEVYRKENKADEMNQYNYTFLTLVRV